ncbi:ABC transporter permease [Lederbergia graminis]|uniref:ABC transporter permease n=1 Tax=Lederbergia graminis TaxID=735518 RepID=A0ABW0LHL3_9BACI
MLATQLKYDLLMFSRELFYFIFTIIVPPVGYLFMGQLFGDQIYAGGLSYVETYTPSFILLITFTVIFFAFGFDQVSNRANGIEKRISISPVPKRVLLVSNILRSIIITSFGFVFILLLGIALYDLQISLLTIFISYLFFILLNAVLLVISSAIYSLFKQEKSALVFSIIIFQVVMFTGDFSFPVSQMPDFVQLIANVNPIYHMNHLFTNVWNQLFSFDKNSLISIGYVLLIFAISLIIIQITNRKKV